eukprot:COSAG01_NODE_534_length_15805_cov_9.468420_1_plen_145_part_00
MASEFYLIERVLTMNPALIAAVTDVKYGFLEWVSTQPREARDKAMAMRAKLLEAERPARETIVCNLLLPIVDFIRMGDKSSPQMGYVYQKMFHMFPRLQAIVAPLVDVDDGGVFDKDILAELETIVTNRWVYLHCPYHRYVHTR